MGVIGLIAGNGVFPLHFAEAARLQGERVIAVALKEEADPALEKLVEEMTWLSLGQLGKTIDYLKARGVTRAVMAGQVKHTQLFKNIVPDFRAAKLLGRLANKKAESLLAAVTQEFQSEGIEFLSSVTYLESWLCPEGPLTKRRLSSQEKKDMDFALPIAKQLAGMDTGQTLVVKDQTVVAIEAMEGTDACIRRAGEVAGPGCVVVKVARPKQDLRFDIPVVGHRTLESMRTAKASAMVLQAGKTLILEKPKFVEDADAAEIALQGAPV